MAQVLSHNGRYNRYHIETRAAPDIEPWPTRFLVEVSKIGLAKLLIREIFHYKGDMAVVTHRPCVYGVFSGPVGGFSPIPEKCVGCLRCTTQYPDMVTIRHNPARQRLGDSYFTSNFVDAVAYEAATGSIPVKGAGYRGRFGGDGWDGMWTDMSEIVRPTRDGIHGREFISTVVDIGRKPGFLTFNDDGSIANPPRTFSIPLPVLFDAPAVPIASPILHQILAETAVAIQTLAILPLDAIQEGSSHIVPLLTTSDADKLDTLAFTPRLIEMDGWDEPLFRAIGSRFPETLICLRTDFIAGAELLRYKEMGVSVFHLTADYHGRNPDGTFVFDLIRAAHMTFVEAGVRDEVTLLGGGGIVAAEHVPKAIIAGLDAVVLDTPLLVALQARFAGDFRNRESGNGRLPTNLTIPWGKQRLQNLIGAWRDQLLEIMGAMGLREVRRLRGEIGRAMFQKDLEREAFAGIEGFED